MQESDRQPGRGRSRESFHYIRLRTASPEWAGSQTAVVIDTMVVTALASLGNNRYQPQAMHHVRALDLVRRFVRREHDHVLHHFDFLEGCGFHNGATQARRALQRFSLTRAALRAGLEGVESIETHSVAPAQLLDEDEATIVEHIDFSRSQLPWTFLSSYSTCLALELARREPEAARRERLVQLLDDAPYLPTSAVALSAALTCASRHPIGFAASRLLKYGRASSRESALQSAAWDLSLLELTDLLQASASQGALGRPGSPIASVRHVLLATDDNDLKEFASHLRWNPQDHFTPLPGSLPGRELAAYSLCARLLSPSEATLEEFAREFFGREFTVENQRDYAARIGDWHRSFARDLEGELGIGPSPFLGDGGGLNDVVYDPEWASALLDILFDDWSVIVDFLIQTSESLLIGSHLIAMAHDLIRILASLAGDAPDEYYAGMLRPEEVHPVEMMLLLALRGGQANLRYEALADRVADSEGGAGVASVVLIVLIRKLVERMEDVVGGSRDDAIVWLKSCIRIDEN